MSGFGPDEIVAKKFRIVRLLGEGGMGMVYEAVHLGLGRRVALKMLKPELARKPAVAERFAREGRIAAQIEDRHVCAVLDVGELEDGTTYLVMEYLAGESLAQLLERESKLSPERAVEILLDVCHGVASAHARGVVHRDLKPGNVFLVPVAGEGTIAKVLDFGIAKIDGAEVVTGDRDVLGTPQYLSPEQFTASHEVDARTDLWALGVILFEMLTGELPFAGGSIAELVAQILLEPPRPVPADVPARLRDAIAACLTKERDKRIATLAELAALVGADARRVAQIDAVERATPATSTAPELRASAARAPASSGSLGGVSPQTGSSPRPSAGFLGTRKGRIALVGGASAALGIALVVVVKLYARHEPKPAAFVNPEGAVEAVAWSADGRFVFSVGGDEPNARLRRWDVHGGVASRSFAVEGSRGHFSRNAAWYASIRADGHVGVWNVLAGVRTWEVATSEPLVVSPLEDGHRVLVGHADGAVRLWSHDEGSPVVLAKVGSTPTTLRLSRDDARAIVGLADGGFVLLDVAGRREACRASAGSSAIVAVTMNDDGSKAATGDAAGELRTWSGATCLQERAFAPQPGAIARLKLVGGAPLLLAASGTRISVLDPAAPGRERMLEGHRAAVVALSEAPDGKRVVSGDVAGELRIWDLE